MTHKELLDEIQNSAEKIVQMLREPREIGCLTWWACLDKQLRDLERLHRVEPITKPGTQS